MNLYFSYGINMDKTKMHNICNNAKVYGIGKCNGYRFSINSNGCPTIISSDNSSLYGVLWKISDAEVKILETLNGKYKKKINVSIEIINPAQNDRSIEYFNKHVNNNCVEAFSFKDIETTYGSPKQSYIVTILSALKSNYIPQDYIQEIGFWLNIH